MASVAGSGGGASAGAGGLKTYFKTPEGRHKLQYEKTHSPAVVHYNHNGKTVAQMTVAYLKEKPAGQGSTPSTPSAGSGMRSAAARLLGTGNGSRTLSFGSNGTSRAVSGSSRMGGGIGVSTSASGSQGMANYDGKGSYIIFNTADTLFISDLNSHDKATTMVQLKQKILFLCQCTCVAWVPEREGIFVVSHADGNLYVYDKFKDGNTDWTFPTVKDQSQVLISHAKSSKARLGRGGQENQVINHALDWAIQLQGGTSVKVQSMAFPFHRMVLTWQLLGEMVSAVSFDPCWSQPNSDETEENVMYRFGSVGQVGSR
ncbi:Transducin/WD40 repeat-like superfamily protein [Zea mays]|uniref:Transducin/WD40 repeat-like superfamily protein n=1 Tax=Zea mays TaxID=4577 RepID=A0A1D6QLM5_MAIZE|nr:Transducin/WD40 repeat-like superfamily protein [Zea mays]